MSTVYSRCQVVAIYYRSDKTGQPAVLVDLGIGKLIPGTAGEFGGVLDCDLGGAEFLRDELDKAISSIKKARS